MADFEIHVDNPTPQEALALDLERVARDFDRVRQLHRPVLDSSLDARLSDLFASLYRTAHETAPDLVGEEPHWLER